MRDKQPRRVYFIKPIGSDGPVKIGCSWSPEARLKQMTRKDRPLEIVARIGGDYFVERQFHTLFRASHTQGEWFDYTPAMGKVVAAINAGTFDAATLPDKPPRLPRKAIEYTPERRAHMSEMARQTHQRKLRWAARFAASKDIAVTFADLAQGLPEPASERQAAA